jgi:hypothetical protein
VPGEFIGDDNVPKRIRVPYAKLHVLPDIHATQLNEPRPVGIVGEPGVRVPVKVDLQVFGPLVQPGRRHQALLTRRGVLSDEESGLLQLIKKPLLPASGRLGQRTHDAFKISVMPRCVQIRNLQAVVARKDALQYLGHHVRLGELERFQELPGRREVRYGAPYRGNARHGRAWKIGGRAVPGVKWCYVAAIFEPDDRLCPRGAGLFTGPGSVHRVGLRWRNT